MCCSMQFRVQIDGGDQVLPRGRRRPGRPRRRSPAVADSFSGSFSDSIIWPSTASARTIAGLRYLNASSNALMVRSHISCTERGGQDDGLVVAVAAALHRLIVIALLRADVAQARAGAHDVDDDRRQLGAGQVGDAFLHQADARSGGGGHGQLAGAGRAVDHVDGAGLALRLEILLAQLGE